MSALDHASTDLDKFLVWDASATAFKTVTAATLLNNTLAGVSVGGLTALTLANTDAAADYFPVFDASATAWKKMLASELANKLLAYVTTAYVATPTAITTASSGQRLSNRAATQIIEFDLPAATTGQRYSFNRIENYAVRVDPNGTDFIGDGAAGKYLEITARGQVNIECITNGEWEVVGGSATFTFEA